MFLAHLNINIELISPGKEGEVSTSLKMSETGIRVAFIDLFLYCLTQG